MEIKKKHLTILIPLALFWLCALGFATVYDLDISLAIADSNSIYGKIFEISGEPPAILLTSFNFSLMAAYFIKSPHRNIWNYIFAVLSYVGVIGTAFYAISCIASYLYDYGIIREGTFPVIILTAAVSAVFCLITAKTKRETTQKYFGTACHGVLCAALTLVVIWLCKFMWGRVRFRQLDGDLSKFTPWYLPQGFTGYFSFPSGHTANATVLFSAVYYFRFLSEKMKIYKPLFYTLLGVWIAVVAFSRVAIGAHYLSDILFGAAITFAIVYFTRPRNNK